MEIVEKHHKLKCDAPSGTAIALADSLNAAMDNQYHYVYDRSQRHEQRDPKEIGISAVRGGTIVGRPRRHLRRPGRGCYPVPQSIFQRSFRKRCSRGRKIPGWKASRYV